MDPITAWQQGHSDGLNLAVQKINEWCGLECKTLSDLILTIKDLMEVTHD